MDTVKLVGWFVLVHALKRGARDGSSFHVATGHVENQIALLVPHFGGYIYLKKGYSHSFQKSDANINSAQ